MLRLVLHTWDYNAPISRGKGNQIIKKLNVEIVVMATLLAISMRFIIEVLEAHILLRLEEEGVKRFEEWVLKKVTPNMAQKWREACSRQI